MLSHRRLVAPQLATEEDSLVASASGPPWTPSSAWGCDRRIMWQYSIWPSRLCELHPKNEGLTPSMVDRVHGLLLYSSIVLVRAPGAQFLDQWAQGRRCHRKTGQGHDIPARLCLGNNGLAHQELGLDEPTDQRYTSGRETW